MNFLTATALIMGATQAPAALDAAEFVTLMRTLHGEIRGISFLFEGEMLALGRGFAGPARPPIRFQGHYSLRTGQPQAGLLEVFETVTPDPPTHRSVALLNGTLERSNRPLPSRILDPRVKRPSSAGGPASLNGSPSPTWFVFSWYFSAYRPAPEAGMLYENLGWEDVAGHRCLKVRLGFTPGNDGMGASNTFWIDLARGGHPLKVESFYKGDLLYRVDPIELTQATTADGKSVWFPAKGEVNVFGSIGGEIRQSPMAKETYSVVIGSLQLNIDLPDSVFVVHTRPRREIGNSNVLRGAHPVEVKPAKVARPKTDPASVQARLDAHLAEAARQSREIEASSPARSSWGWTGATQAALALAGVALIGSVGAWKWRQS